MAQPSFELPEECTLPVYTSNDLMVTCGANEGDGLGIASDLVLDDLYVLSPDAQRHQLSMVRDTEEFLIDDCSAVGVPGRTLHLDCVVTFMGNGANTIQALVLVEIDQHGLIRQTYLAPTAPMATKCSYSLLKVDRASARDVLTQMTCVSFVAGTQITLADGVQRPVETLKAGDMVLTRDHGFQPLRRVGFHTQRAQGAFAPVRISAGAFGNMSELLVCPEQRLFFFQRSNVLNTKGPAIAVRAGDLMNGSTVSIYQGGHVDYVQLLFDTHEYVYAEGIAAETARQRDTDDVGRIEKSGAAQRAGYPAWSGTRVSFVSKQDFHQQDPVKLLQSASHA